MAKPVQQLKKIGAVLDALTKQLMDEDRWAADAPLAANLEALLSTLDELVALERPFSLVDSVVRSRHFACCQDWGHRPPRATLQMPWPAKARRMVNWLRSHPRTTCIDVDIVDDLPAEQGGRGVVVREAVAKGDTVLRVPFSCMLSTSGALRTRDLGVLLSQPQVGSIRDLPTVLLTLHLMAEHAKCLAAAPDAGASASTDVPSPAADWQATSASEDLLAAIAAAGGVLPEPEPEENEGGHGHSHGDEPCHGHGHGERREVRVGGSGGGAGAGAAAAAATDGAGGHGHSHGGKPCHGHGHGHGHGASSERGGIFRTRLVAEAAAADEGADGSGGPPPPRPAAAHAWGSEYRAYIATLPPSPASCLFFSPRQFRRLAGLPVLPTLAKFVRDSATTFVKLYAPFGAAAGACLLAGFEPYFTWAHFRWAMSCVMSRQNRVPLPGRDPLSGRDFTLALVPLYDMVNACRGPVTSYFFSDRELLALDADAAYAPGAQLRMSYGNRQSHSLLQFQGFVPEDIDPVAAAAAIAAAGGGGGVPLPSPTDEYAVVEARLVPVGGDPLFRIRASVLKGLEIRPETNCTRHVQTAAAKRDAEIARQAVAAGTPGIPADAVERLHWSHPFAFQLYADGRPSDDLLSFLRVACVAGKADAAVALRQSDGARRALTAALAAVRARHAEREGRHLARRQALEAARRRHHAAEEAAAGGGEPAAAAVESGSSGGSSDAAAAASWSLAAVEAALAAEEAEDVAAEEADEGLSFQLKLEPVSAANEAAALRVLADLCAHALAALDDDAGDEAEAEAAAEGAEGDSGSSGKGRGGGGRGGKSRRKGGDRTAKGKHTAAASEAAAAGAYDPVEAYRGLQHTILGRGVAWAKAALAEAAAREAAAAAAAPTAVAPAAAKPSL